MGALFIAVLDYGFFKFEISPAYMTILRSALVLLIASLMIRIKDAIKAVCAKHGSR